MDYVQFCGSLNPTHILAHDERITAREFAELPGDSPILLDVRERVQYDICALPQSINCPMSEIMSSERKSRSEAEETRPAGALAPWTSFLDSFPETQPVHVVCRQGNDSQIIVKRLQELGIDRGGARLVRDIKGGIDAWRRDVDPAFPDY
jgi:adenylyltransferase/sulfurtransferase